MIPDVAEIRTVMSLIRGAEVRKVKTRLGGLFEAIRDAAPVDPDIEALWDRIQMEFRANQRVIVDRLGARKALRRGLGVVRATDVLWTINHPDLRCC